LRPLSHRRLRWFRFAVGAFALALMVFVALHAPVGVLASAGQHTAASLGNHARQPCLDSPSFDWTVPQSDVSLILRVPRCARRSSGLNQVTYSPSPVEFPLSNRPPPLS
jgi:hypothetical protein